MVQVKEVVDMAHVWRVQNREGEGPYSYLTT